MYILLFVFVFLWMMKKLGIGQQSFVNLINDKCVYVDKTAYLHQLIDSGSWYYFFSRPRRFGKSLLLSTIQAIFEGKKELFEGLYIHDKINWEERSVILLDMSKNAESIEILKEAIFANLKRIATNNDIELSNHEPSVSFAELIYGLYKKTGKQVVLLIDEYDKPILDSITDLDRATEIRSFLADFYTVIKSSGEALRFVMLTGVSKISQTSIFSGLNNLNDISFQEDYADICGYTQYELEKNFGGHITELAKDYSIDYQTMLAKIKYWYNGYSWDGKNFVYNPFSILLLLEHKTFDPHWFNTGTPTFLIKLLEKKNDFSPLLQKEIKVKKGFSDKQLLENLDVVPLCFQTGYLTIKSYDFLTNIFKLQIPNEEVRQALTESTLADLTKQSFYRLNILAKNIKDGFANGDITAAVDNLRILFSQISYNTHIPLEAHYHALFQLTMNMADIEQQAESYSNIGRTDSILKIGDKVYVTEIKYTDSPEKLELTLAEAMLQIKTKRYYEPYLNQNLTVYLLALTFTKGDVDFKEETFSSKQVIGK